MNHRTLLAATLDVRTSGVLSPWRKNNRIAGRHLHKSQAAAWQSPSRLSPGVWESDHADPGNYSDGRVSVYNQGRSRHEYPAVWDNAGSQWSEASSQGPDDAPFHHLLSVAGSIAKALGGTSSWVTDVVLHLCPPGTQRLLVELVVKVVGSASLFAIIRSMLPVLVPFMGILVVATFSSAAISLSTSNPPSAQDDRRAYRGQRTNIQYQQPYQGGPGTRAGSRPLSSGPYAQPRIRRRTQVRRIVEQGKPWQGRNGDVSDVWYGASGS